MRADADNDYDDYVQTFGDGDALSRPGKAGGCTHLSLPHLFCSICWYKGLEDSSMAIVAACEMLRKLVHACGSMYVWAWRTVVWPSLLHVKH